MKRIRIDRDEMAFSEIFDFFAPKINAYFIQNRICLLYTSDAADDQ